MLYHIRTSNMSLRSHLPKFVVNLKYGAALYIRCWFSTNYGQNVLPQLASCRCLCASHNPKF